MTKWTDLDKKEKGEVISFMTAGILAATLTVVSFAMIAYLKDDLLSYAMLFFYLATLLYLDLLNFMIKIDRRSVKENLADLNLQVEELMERVKDMEKSENNRA